MNPERILVVDDSIGLRALLCQGILLVYGNEVLVGAHGMQALSSTLPVARQIVSEPR
jgi:hypothetical protein